ncbi:MULTISPECIES: hypothetical protein [unclassified Sphingomonas]|uniref:hypothetical protein n=1 Tax=unclassified Sphingomonas TaxID=196159 RepID=UPI0025F5403E|nr:MULTISPECIES: hypothetical protein [unclassified Sphingomonas]
MPFQKPLENEGQYDPRQEPVSLHTALDHLRRFRATFNAGEPVDEESELTADDLTAIINAVEAFGDDVVAGDPS